MPIINSMLDSDYYKFSMGQCAYFFLKGVDVKYKFIMRSSITFPDGFDARLQEEVNHLATLKLTPAEYDWLVRNPNMYNYYLSWFATYHFDPNEVQIHLVDGKLDITIEGPWYRSIYWETPLLAIISELYFSMTGQSVDIRTVLDRTVDKGKQLAGMPFIEFGTRRRISFEAQNQVINGLMNSDSKDNLLGTSNPYFAKKYGIPVQGTYAHEAPMVMQAIYGPWSADNNWMSYWRPLYGKALNIALSDTLTTKHFLSSLDELTFQMLDGFRIDSGNPIEIGYKIVNRLKELHIDPLIKIMIFSDNLNPEKARVIWNEFNGKTKPIFGIGTDLTNSFGPAPLNMVIKLIEANNTPVVKLSDTPEKYTGDLRRIDWVKKELNIS